MDSSPQKTLLVVLESPVCQGLYFQSWLLCFLWYNSAGGILLQTPVPPACGRVVALPWVVSTLLSLDCMSPLHLDIKLPKVVCLLQDQLHLKTCFQCRVKTLFCSRVWKIFTHRFLKKCPFPQSLESHLFYTMAGPKLMIYYKDFPANRPFGDYWGNIDYPWR